MAELPHPPAAHAGTGLGAACLRAARSLYRGREGRGHLRQRHHDPCSGYGGMMTLFPERNT